MQENSSWQPAVDGLVNEASDQGKGKDKADWYRLKVETLGVLSFAFSQSKQPLIYQLTFTNNSPNVLTQLTVAISFQYDFIEPYSCQLAQVNPGQESLIEPEFSVDCRKLFELTERIDDRMTFRVFDAEGQIYAQEAIDLPVLPINQWSGVTLFPESLGTFVLPNIPQVSRLHQRAAQILQQKYSGEVFDGYQEDKNKIRHQMAAVYAAICEENIAYALPPASFEGIGQRVRTPDEVLNFHLGTCIEMAILFASTLESVGLNPFIVITKGHAFAGTWLIDEIFPDNVCTDVEALTKRLARGVNEIEVLECTAMNGNKQKSFEYAVKIGHEHLKEPRQFVQALDISRIHSMGIRPMPIRVMEDGEARVIDYGLPSDKTNLSGVSQTVEDYYLDTSQKEASTKAKVWMTGLLDLSKRNSLISFKPTAKSLQIIFQDIDRLEDGLSKGRSYTIRGDLSDVPIYRKQIHLLSDETVDEGIGRLIQKEFDSGRLHTYAGEEELIRSLKTLYREAKKAKEENGSSSLYLALGFLKWQDVKDKTDLYAPLILLPVDLQRRSMTHYELVLRDEDPQMNVTLLEKLRVDYGLNIGGLSPLPLDGSGVDIRLVLNSVRHAILSFPAWDVLDVAILGNFSFSQFVMWSDLKDRFDRLTESKVVKGFVSKTYEGKPEPALLLDQVEDEQLTDDVVLPSPFDSSQLAAILEANRGKSFVLHGPPGTGKSQTITNMIANALYHGKKVLFVAEKMAALSVVSRRLEKMGLGDFALEMHSDKAKKQSVLDKWQHNLTLYQGANGHEKAKDNESLRTCQEDLAAQMQALHQKRAVGKSLSELIDSYLTCRLDQDQITMPIDETVIEGMDENILEQLLSHCRYLTQALTVLPEAVGDHPFRKIHCPNFEGQDIKQLRQVIERARKDLKEAIGVSNRLNLRALVAQHSDSFQVIEAALTFLLEKGAGSLTEQTLQAAMTPHFQQKLLQYLNSRKDLLLTKGQLLQHYVGEIVTFDWRVNKAAYLEAGQKFFFKGYRQNKVLQALNVLAKAGEIVDKAKAMNTYDQLARYHEQEQLVEANEKEVKSLLGLKSTETLDIDGEVLLQLVNLLQKLKGKHSWLTDDCLRQVFDPLLRLPVNEIEDGRDNIRRWRDDYRTLVPYLKDPLIDDPQYSWQEQVLPQLEDMVLNSQLLKDWLLFDEALTQLDSWGFSGISAAIRQSSTSDPEILYREIVGNILKQLIDAYVEQTPVMARFSGIKATHLVKEYRHLLKDFQKQSQLKVHEHLAESIRALETSSSQERKELASLTHAIQSKGRSLSIRKIFQEHPHIIRRLSPCLLMSPLSVAQYIDLSFPKYDLIIFDEASQIQTNKAIGALSRAENAIIVGDPKQMPPTSFFQKKVDTEESSEEQDLESLLDDCLGINMPERHLSWHYRSQSESLIAFSNQTYYGGQMYTFPSPEDGQSKVKFHLVKGVYDRGNSRTNRLEAEAVVQELVKRLQDPVLRRLSMGVVTFNQAQQELIDDLLQNYLDRHTDLKQLVEEMPEKIFIKNLETVQGDERDVILFSIGYGPDEEGKLRMNFGPLNKNGGWRRLNVACSRSRVEMIVFASFEARDLKLTPKSAAGVQGLKSFMTYAAEGTLNTQETRPSDPTVVTPMQKKIVTFLEGQGYKCRMNLGSSKLKIDIAVVDPDDESRFLCALLMDGLAYARIPTVKDRHDLVPGVLERSGWSVYRIWSVDWLEKEEREQNNLLTYLGALNGEMI